MRLARRVVLGATLAAAAMKRNAWSAQPIRRTHERGVRHAGTPFCLYRRGRRCARLPGMRIVADGRFSPMHTFLRTRLGAMMFLQYVIWGAWYVTITTYLTTTLHFSATAAGAVFGTASVASLVSPFFVGLVADRFFATERVMATLYVLKPVRSAVASATALSWEPATMLPEVAFPAAP